MPKTEYKDFSAAMESDKGQFFYMSPLDTTGEHELSIYLGEGKVSTIDTISTDYEAICRDLHVSVK